MVETTVDGGSKPELDALRSQIHDLVGKYHELAFRPRPFVPGITPVPVSGKVFDAREIARLIDAALEFWLTTGRHALELERLLAKFVGVRHCFLCNSGSSANLLAVSALTSPRLGERALRRGDEVLTVASGFPTTVNPLIQNGLVPVFVDVDLGTYNADVGQLESAIGPRTRAVILAHTLGNPFNVDAVSDLVRRHNLWLIEDNCDGLGSTYEGRQTGSFGHVSTCSFYPAHHITTGEGGAVFADDPALKPQIESFREWGRDCWCEPGVDDTCGKRFGWKLGSLPFGYDHKYVYSHVGYNLKMTDLQAAIGVVQVSRLSEFAAVRKRNFRLLRSALEPLEEFLLLPEATPKSDPSWFGFPLTIRAGAHFDRPAMVRFLEGRKIATRLLFGGNLMRQPAYTDVGYRTAGDLPNSDTVMERTFWVGVFPGLTEQMMAYVGDSIVEFVTAAMRTMPRAGRD